MSENTERDELIRLIWDDAVADRVKDGKDPERVPVVRPKVEAMADVLLAAGYRKPQQVTTVEELDALPAGTVIRDGDPLTCIKWGDGTWGTFAGGSCPTSRITLPATVLHVGGAE